MKRKDRELENRLQAEAEREAREHRAAIAAAVGGDPVLDLPVVKSTTNVIAAAKAEVEKRFRAAEENEEDIRATYRAQFFAELGIAAKTAGADYARAAQELEKCLLVLLGLNDFSTQYAAPLFNAGAVARLFVPALEPFAPPPEATRNYRVPCLATGEDLGAGAPRVMVELERDLSTLVGPKAAVWKKPPAPLRPRRPTRW